MVDHHHYAVDGFPQIVRRGCLWPLPTGDALRAVHQQIGKARGQHGGLHEGFVKIGVKVHGLLFEIAHQFHGKLGKPRLGITHGGGAVAVHRAKVTLALHQHVAGGKILRQAHHRVVHGTIAVGMVFTHAIAHDTGAFAVGLVRP